MFSDAFNFNVQYLHVQPKVTCKLLTHTNETITIIGDSVEEIYDKCVKQCPYGLQVKGIFFVNTNSLEAKTLFCSFVAMGLKSGYFKESDFIIYNFEDDYI